MIKRPPLCKEHVARAQEIYEREIRARLEPQEEGKFIVLNVDTSEYENAAVELTASWRARARFGDAPQVMLPIGRCPGWARGLFIDYWLCGFGWCGCTVRIGEHRAQFYGSWLEDSLRDLIGAVLRLAANDGDDFVQFNDENEGRYRWDLAKRGDHLCCHIVQLPLAVAARTLLESSCQWPDFVAALTRAVDHLLQHVGETGYLAGWGKEFPRDDYGALRAMTASNGVTGT